MVTLLDKQLWPFERVRLASKYTRKRQTCPTCGQLSLYRTKTLGWGFCFCCRRVEISAISSKHTARLRSRLLLHAFFLELETAFHTLAVPDTLLTPLWLPLNPQDPRQDLFRQGIGFCLHLQQLKDTCQDLGIPLFNVKKVHWDRPGLMIPVQSAPGYFKSAFLLEAEQCIHVYFSEARPNPSEWIIIRYSKTQQYLLWKDLPSLSEDAYLYSMRYPKCGLISEPECTPAAFCNRSIPEDFGLLPKRYRIPESNPRRLFLLDTRIRSGQPSST